MDSKKLFWGLDIGGTKCAIVTGDEECRILSRHAISTADYKNWEEVLETLLSFAPEEKPLAIGVSCGGPLDSKNGLILSPPNLPGWDEVPIVRWLEEKTGARAYLQNDANACALAEWRFGAGKGCDNMVFLTFGTGFGAGLILNGKLYAGTNDMAGEVGHVRAAADGPVGYGKAGSFEGFCSGGGIAQIGQMVARERLQMGQKVSFCESLDKILSITAKEIAMQAKAGQEDAKEVYNICGKLLGKGLSILIDILNPEKIVLGSVFARSSELLVDAMRAELEKECLPRALAHCEIVPAALQESLGDVAALSVAVNGLKK